MGKTLKLHDKQHVNSEAETNTGRWTLFTNHAHVLVVLAQSQEVLLREVAQKIGLTERAVQKIVADLEEAGFLRKEKVGRTNQYKLLLDKPLRHPIEAHKLVRDVIQLILKP